MEAQALEIIRREIEKIEKGTGHGQVLITIMNGKVRLLKPTPTILMVEKEES